MTHDDQNAPTDAKASCTIARTKHPGNSSVAIHDSDKVCALGGWDGKYVISSLPSIPSPRPAATPNMLVSIAELIYLIPSRTSNRIRLYSIKTFKPLGTLDYHKDGVQALTFARTTPAPSHPLPCSGVTPASAGVGENDEDVDEDDEFSNSEVEARKRWLVAGGKDGRISIWELMDFVKPKQS